MKVVRDKSPIEFFGFELALTHFAVFPKGFSSKKLKFEGAERFIGGIAVILPVNTQILSALKSQPTEHLLHLRLMLSQLLHP